MVDRCGKEERQKTPSKACRTPLCKPALKRPLHAAVSDQRLLPLNCLFRAEKGADRRVPRRRRLVGRFLSSAAVVFSATATGGRRWKSGSAAAGSGENPPHVELVEQKRQLGSIAAVPLLHGQCDLIGRTKNPRGNRPQDLYGPVVRKRHLRCADA